ncbi:MAG: SH3 domain-containing protein [Qingshengfaniella sp.]
MAFKLTVLLCLFMFVTMYFVGDPPPRPETGLIVGQDLNVLTPGAPAPTRTPPTSPSPSDPPASSTPPPPSDTDRPAIARALPDQPNDFPETAARNDAPPPGDQAAPTISLGLGRLSLGNDAAAALSLADSVRQRAEEARNAAPTPPPAPVNTVAPTGSPPTSGAQTSGARALPLATITVSAVNLRTGPSTAYPVVGRSDLGQKVELIDENVAPGWAAIRIPGTPDTVYIANRYLIPL